ncbi:hypothetical protein [Streptomyces californicus]|uniref:hypothetical protein n=1 Tax=Streptomyces californicus TaxID=67351 RepID=UPI0036CCBF81
MYRAIHLWRHAPPAVPVPARIGGLSSRTVAAIHCVEFRNLGKGLLPGDTRTALRCYRWFLSRPGRYLYLTATVCGCYECGLKEDVAIARDLIELVLARLSRRARRELASLVAVLDGELERRTLPDPHAHRRPWVPGERWWHHRLYDESHHL